MSVPENPKQTKNPITLKIKFKSSSLEQFIERYSVDVSKSGIFIRTKEPLSVGTQLKFEFQLQDGNALLSGEGKVIWNRAPDPSRSSVAPGMGVHFEKLSADSQKVLERILAEKARRPDSNLESRFDAGVRALREGSVSDAQLTSQQTPKGDNGSFGDEPTRAMAADQVNKLAEAMQEEDPPTRQGSPPDLTDEVRRAMGAAADAAKNLAPMAQLTPMTAPAGGPPANLGRTLLGQGFMMAPRSGGSADAPSSPGTSSRDAPSVEILRKETSQPMAAGGSGSGDSAKTPTASVDEQRARIADSHRTPTGGHHKSGAESPGAAADAGLKSASPLGRPSEPVSRPIDSATFPPPIEQPLVLGSTSSAVAATSGKRSGSAMGLIVGVVVLLAILAALGFVFLNGKNKLRGTGAVGTTDPGTSGTPTIPTNPAVTGTTPDKTTEAKTEPTKLEPTSVPVKPAEPAEGVEITTDPPGAHIEFAGKNYGPTPVRVPGLAIGSKITLSLRGYQEAKIPFRNAPDETKPLFFKLTAIERVVEVNSTPKGADVILDGKKVGKTPFVLKKLDTAKVHQVEVRRPGYAAWTHNVSDTESFVVKNRKEVLSLNAVLQAIDDGAKKGPGHAPKRDGAGPAAPVTGGGTPVTPTELPKPPPESAPPAAAAPEPVKEAPPSQ